MSLRVGPLLGLGILALAMALLAAPVSAQGLTVTVDTPQSGDVVEGEVVFQGTAEDAEGGLRWVELWIENATGATPRDRISGNQANATWEIPWNSLSVPDGHHVVSVVARNRTDDVSPAENLTLIVDNAKDPTVEDLRILHDANGTGEYLEWDNFEAVPTTRLALVLEFSEEIEASTLAGAVSFGANESSWELGTQEGSSQRVEVSYLAANASYTFSVGTGATDAAGNPLAEAYTFAFHTAPEATPGTPDGPGGGLSLPIALDSPWLWGAGGAGAAGIVLAVAWRKGALSRVGEKIRSFRGRGEDEA